MSQQFTFLFSGKPSAPPLSGRELRDSGMASVLANSPDEWKEAFKSKIENLASGSRFTIEEITDSLGKRPAEIHFNVTGALTHSVAKAGLIRKTGRVFKAKRASLRSTDTPEWERV